MSSPSMCYAVTRDESGDSGASTRGSVGAGKHEAGGSSLQVGIWKREKVGDASPPLKVTRESHRIRKQPLPLPQVQYRPPIIIHTYSPKVIHTRPDDFMSLVQKLTGSSDTRLRLKRKPTKKSSSPAPDQKDSVDPVADLEQQGSKTGQCASPSSSEEDSCFLTSETCGGEQAKKQSHSPRSPLTNFEFDIVHDILCTPFDTPSSNSLLSHVKTEPSFPVNDNSFNGLTDSFVSQLPKGMMKQEAFPKQVLHQDYSLFHNTMDVNSGIPSPGFFPPSSMCGVSDLSSISANWPQSFLDSHSGAPSLFTNQNEILRQRFLGGGYTRSSEGTMVALENIQAFMLS